MTQAVEVPEGYVPIIMVEAFTSRIGPIYSRQTGENIQIGFRVEKSHLNIEKVVHGGMLATIADQVIGINIAHGAGPGHDVLTMHLSVDYIGPAYLGDWVEATATLTKRGGRIRFGNCELRVGDRLVLTGSAIFAARVTNRTKEAAAVQPAK